MKKDWNAIVFGLVIVVLVLVFMVAMIADAQEINLETIKEIESGGDPQAISDAGAIGLYQIMPITLKDYNQRHEIKYDRTDLFKPGVNRKVAEWYITVRIPGMLRYYDKAVTTRNILWAYNAGIGNLLDGVLPRETKRYFQKYKKLSK